MLIDEKRRAHIYTGYTTGEVYDDAQTNDGVHSGDVLVVPRERVVGFLIGAWPVAVTSERGAFHPKNPERTWDTVQYPDDGIDYKSIAAFAVATAKELGWPVNE